MYSVKNGFNDKKFCATGDVAKDKNYQGFFNDKDQRRLDKLSAESMPLKKKS